MSEEIKEEKIRKVFLDDLPRWESGRFNGNIKWSESNKHRVNFIYDNIIGEIEIIDYIPMGQYLYIKYLDNPIFKIKTTAFLNCKLGGLLDSIVGKFKYKIGENIIDDNRNITIIDRKYIIVKRIRNGRDGVAYIKYYKFKCNKCGFECGEHYRNQEYREEHWIAENNLLNNNGCSCCANPSKIVVVGINSIIDTDDWMIPYFQGGYDEAKMYTSRSHSKIYPVCPDCGRIKDKAISIDNININHSIGCICSDNISRPEKFVMSILKQLNLKFKYQYYSKWCKYNDIEGKERYGIYDFKIDGSIYLIETDGGWHNKDNKMSGQTKEESKHIDNIKDKLAKENGYEVIRIDCNYENNNIFKYIKNSILNSKLSILFDLSKIDWLLCSEFAMSNLEKVACDYKNNNPNLTTTEISKIMNISIDSVNTYLKNGTELKWCNYNSRKSSRKEVLCLDTGMIFESTVECFKKSNELFKVILNDRGISNSCRNKGKLYKGYHFKYISDLTPEERVLYKIDIQEQSA